MIAHECERIVLCVVLCERVPELLDPLAVRVHDHEDDERNTCGEGERCYYMLSDVLVWLSPRVCGGLPIG